jgi:2-hydroxy-6-oxonona-2,4-dienedioate hydrolase
MSSVNHFNKWKPVVIMLHGTAGSWEGFAENLGPLSEHFDCYAIDMIGCGYTDKPDMPYETSVYGTQHLGRSLAQSMLPTC